MARARFVFSDSLQTGGHLDAASPEGEINKASSATYLAANLPRQHFAGVVCVAN